MATPNQMPKKPSAAKQKLVASLIETSPSSWKKKTLVKGEGGKEKVKSETVKQQSLRWPLAANISESNVERAARSLL